MANHKIIENGVEREVTPDDYYMSASLPTEVPGPAVQEFFAKQLREQQERRKAPSAFTLNPFKK